MWTAFELPHVIYSIRLNICRAYFSFVFVLWNGPSWKLQFLNQSIFSFYKKSVINLRRARNQFDDLSGNFKATRKNDFPISWHRHPKLHFLRNTWLRFWTCLCWVVNNRIEREDGRHSSTERVTQILFNFSSLTLHTHRVTLNTWKLSHTHTHLIPRYLEAPHWSTTIHCNLEFHRTIQRETNRHLQLRK